jgi:hypothetical protein
LIDEAVARVPDRLLHAADRTRKTATRGVEPSLDQALARQRTWRTTWDRSSGRRATSAA